MRLVSCPGNSRGSSGVRAFARLSRRWKITNEDAAALADTTPRTWQRMKSTGAKPKLSQDQRLRLSALVGLYKGLHLYFSDDLADMWVSMPNGGPLFRGSTPLAYMREGGLPAILNTRNYVDALRGGL